MAKRCRVYKPKAQRGINVSNVNYVDPGANQIPWYQRPDEAGQLSNSWDAGIQRPVVNTPYIPPAAPEAGPSVTNIKGSSNPQYNQQSEERKRAAIKKRISFGQDGGESGSQSAMTQDSQKDPVHIESTDKFINWLHQSKEKSRVKKMMEEDMARIDSGEYQIGGNIYQDGGDINLDQLREALQPKKVDPRETSGYESGNYGQKRNKNLGYLQAAVANISEPMEHIATIASGLNAMAGSHGRPNFNFKQTPQQSKAYGSDDITMEGQSPDAMPDTGFGSGQSMNTFGRNTDQSFGQPNPSGVKLDESFNQPVGGFDPNLYMQKGGISYPGGPWDPTDTDTSGEAFEDYMRQEQANPEDSYQTAADYNVDNNEASADPFAKYTDAIPNQGFGSMSMDPFGKSNAENVNQVQGAMAIMKGGIGLAGYKGDREKQAELNKELSNIYNFHDTVGSDRGDYMANVPGVGNFFKPDEHTRMGYNTKIAQKGREVDQYSIAKERYRQQLLDQVHNMYTNKKYYPYPSEPKMIDPVTGMENMQDSIYYNPQNAVYPSKMMDPVTTMQQFAEPKRQVIRRQEGGEEDYINAPIDGNTTQGQVPIGYHIEDDYVNAPTPLRNERKFQQAVYEDENNNWGNNELDWIKNSLKRTDWQTRRKNHREYMRENYPRTDYYQQGGEYNIDDELELTEAQLGGLIKQGYQLEYLD